ncbi:hypothetical protein PGT21_028161 [Puccinia graminis f. sp. tritici]|uniref:Uncharacterized protein n=1 Tax=Puccinia graminis f. sp. tritici TaxID=56615 RepID=A0A5B0LR34_PUCGR|nr:hypothetical protein PGT21_028161 [Puccinia graminis f. sp. tritici]
MPGKQFSSVLQFRSDCVLNEPLLSGRNKLDFNSLYFRTPPTSLSAHKSNLTDQWAQNPNPF